MKIDIAEDDEVDHVIDHETEIEGHEDRVLDPDQDLEEEDQGQEIVKETENGNVIERGTGKRTEKKIERGKREAYHQLEKKT